MVLEELKQQQHPTEDSWTYLIIYRPFVDLAHAQKSEGHGEVRGRIAIASSSIRNSRGRVLIPLANPSPAEVFKRENCFVSLTKA